MAAVVSLAVGAPAARAQLIDCPTVSQVGGLKVMLDDVQAVTVPGVASPAPSPGRMAFLMTRKLGELRVELGDPPEVVVCPGRRPKTMSDFNLQQVDQLNASDVVLEFWGVLEPVDAANQRALLGFSVPPLRFYEHFGQRATDIPGVYQSELTFAAAQPEALLAQSGELKAYVALGVGLKAFKLRQYARAQKSFCRARFFLQPGPTPPTDPEQRALVDYASRKAREVVEAARAAPAGDAEARRYKVFTAEQAAQAARCGS